MKAAAGQKNAIAAIKKSRGHVEYDYEFESDESTRYTNEVPHGPTRLRNLLGDDFFNDVWWANLQKDADMAKTLPNGFPPFTAYPLAVIQSVIVTSPMLRLKV